MKIEDLQGYELTRYMLGGEVLAPNGLAVHGH